MFISRESCKDVQYIERKELHFPWRDVAKFIRTTNVNALSTSVVQFIFTTFTTENIRHYYFEEGRIWFTFALQTFRLSSSSIITFYILY